MRSRFVPALRLRSRRPGNFKFIKWVFLPARLVGWAVVIALAVLTIIGLALGILCPEIKLLLGCIYNKKLFSDDFPLTDYRQDAKQQST